MSAIQDKQNNDFLYPFGHNTPISKVGKYNWKIQDSQGGFMYINKNDLNVDHNYQRDNISNSKIVAMASNWSWIALGAISVGLRDNKYWVIDGQNRTLAAQRRSDIQDLPCIVFNTCTIAEEARGFLNVNTGRKPITSIDKYKASVAANDEIAKYVKESFRKLGIVPKQTTNNPREIKCLDWCISRATEDKIAFFEILSLAAELCENCPIPNILLDGLFYINKHTADGVFDKRINQKIRRIGALGLTQAAKRASAFYVKGGAFVWARGMLEDINKGFRDKIVFIN